LSRWPKKWVALGYVCASDLKKVVITLEDWDRIGSSACGARAPGHAPSVGCSVLVCVCCM
jgi:hypothetical protein